LTYKWMDRYEIARLTREREKKKKASWNIVNLNLVS
jgi:hypothetical protein